jgi:hypothetical protein
MSKFINKKEEVIELELTPYGKHMFSQGLLKPSYYSFYDDDILYDSHYGVTKEDQQEDQNQIVDRIKNTQRLAVQVNYTSSVGTTRSTTNVGKAEFINLSEANLKFMQPMGNSSPFSDYAPSWNITTLQNSVNFSGSATYATNLAIPTLTGSLNLVYNRETVQRIGSPEENEGEQQEYIHYDFVQDDRLVIDVLELNTIFKASGNYDIEVFRARDGDLENLEQLGFINTTSNAGEFLAAQQSPEVFDSSLSGDESTIEGNFPTLDSSYVEYFLSIRVDQEIEDVVARPGDNLYKSGRINFPDDICRPT